MKKASFDGFLPPNEAENPRRPDYGLAALKDVTA
jgi:hypothetical protein